MASHLHSVAGGMAIRQRTADMEQTVHDTIYNANQHDLRVQVLSHQLPI